MSEFSTLSTNEMTNDTGTQPLAFGSSSRYHCQPYTSYYDPVRNLELPVSDYDYNTHIAQVPVSRPTGPQLLDGKSEDEDIFMKNERPFHRKTRSAALRVPVKRYMDEDDEDGEDDDFDEFEYATDSVDSEYADEGASSNASVSYGGNISSRSCGRGRGRGRRRGQSRGMRHPAARGTNPSPARGFSVPAVERLPSRSSGLRIQPHVNKTPTAKSGALVLSRTVSDASLLKRNLSRQDEPYIAKRALGPNDPENVQIINLMDNEGLKWKEIADKLNDARIQSGRLPTFTANAVHNRYNRNAPILFAAEGKHFTPIHERKHKGNEEDEEEEAAVPKYFWTDELDKVLVECIKHVEHDKWANVSRLFNSRTNSKISAKAAASRHVLI